MFSQLTCSVQPKTAWKTNYLIKTGVFSLFRNYLGLRPSNNSRLYIDFNINAVVLIVIIF